MIRFHLFEWRANVRAENYQQYLDEVKKLPVEDQPLGYGLWNIRYAERLAVIMAFHNVERAKDEGLLPATVV